MTTEAIDFNALGGKDTIRVNDLSGDGPERNQHDLAATIDGTSGDGAADTIIINATNGNDVIGARWRQRRDLNFGSGRPGEYFGLRGRQ